MLLSCKQASHTLFQPIFTQAERSALADIEVLPEKEKGVKIGKRSLANPSADQSAQSLPAPLAPMKIVIGERY